MGAEGGGPGGAAEKGGSVWSDAPNASCIEGSDWRAGWRCCSFSSPDVRRDSGGDSKPCSGPGPALAPSDW